MLKSARNKKGGQKKGSGATSRKIEPQSKKISIGKPPMNLLLETDCPGVGLLIRLYPNPNITGKTGRSQPPDE